MSDTYLIVDRQGDVQGGKAWLLANVPDAIIETADSVMGANIYILQLRRRDLGTVRQKFEMLLLADAN
jgi:hypothetical protein